jgi:hypothetical protein
VIAASRRAPTGERRKRFISTPQVNYTSSKIVFCCETCEQPFFSLQLELLFPAAALIFNLASEAWFVEGRRQVGSGKLPVWCKRTVRCRSSW